jgi:hypothetical protein
MEAGRAAITIIGARDDCPSAQPRRLVLNRVRQREPAETALKVAAEAAAQGEGVVIGIVDDKLPAIGIDATGAGKGAPAPPSSKPLKGWQVFCCGIAGISSLNPLATAVPPPLRTMHISA